MFQRSRSGRAGASRVAAAALCATAVFASPASPVFADASGTGVVHAVPGSPANPVVFSFATIGDSRQDPSKADPTTLLPNTTGSLLAQDAIWLQNTKAWARILRTIQAQRVNALFMNGDEVMGYGRAAVPSAWSTFPSVSQVVSSDLMKFYIEYAYWRGMVANMFELGTYVLPVPGNHEVQCNKSISTNTGASACASGKNAYPENEDAFRANMGDLVNDLSANVRFSGVVGASAQNVAGLTAATAPNSSTDGLTTDQSDLSYSFDISTNAGLLHFAVINTDPVGHDQHAPTGWLTNDFAAAASRGAIKFFVFGHKPAFTYNYAAASGGTVSAAGLDNDVPARDAFWALIAKYNATYFCGHEHTIHIDQHVDATGSTPGAMPYQVLVGSGGSPFDDTLQGACPSCVEPTFTNPTDRYYAWAVVRVFASGQVSLDAYGFSDTFGATQAVLSIPSLQ